LKIEAVLSENHKFMLNMELKRSGPIVDHSNGLEYSLRKSFGTVKMTLNISREVKWDSGWLWKG
jgi:hypothetical protein